jgi:hypothetical protein
MTSTPRPPLRKNLMNTDRSSRDPARDLPVRAGKLSELCDATRSRAADAQLVVEHDPGQLPPGARPPGATYAFAGAKRSTRSARWTPSRVSSSSSDEPSNASIFAMR